MRKSYLFLVVLTISTFANAAENLRDLEIKYDNYFAKIKVSHNLVKFKDPNLHQSVRLRSCNRTAWNEMLAQLTDETKDYELLVNTQRLPNSNDDVILKRDNSKLRVTSTTSLGQWSRKIESHWKDLVATSRKRCGK